jgi:hypothetical protein
VEKAHDSLLGVCQKAPKGLWSWETRFSGLMKPWLTYLAWTPIVTSGGKLAPAVQRRSPSNQTEFERICREEWEKLPKYRCAELVVSYPRRLRL